MSKIKLFFTYFGGNTLVNLSILYLLFILFPDLGLRLNYLVNISLLLVIPMLFNIALYFIFKKYKSGFFSTIFVFASLLFFYLLFSFMINGAIANMDIY